MAVTPNYGWPVPVATDYVKDGWEAISDLGNAIDTTVAGLGSGLKLISTNSFTAATAVNIDNVFTSTYANYRLIVNVTSATSNPTLSLRLRAAGSTIATGYFYAFWDTGSNATSGASGSTNGTSILLVPCNGNRVAFVSDLISPQEAQPIKTFSTAYYDDSTSNGIRLAGGQLNNTTQYDGFSLVASANSISGNYYLYGYQKS